ncbi:MAG TPA: hypothetical protein VIV09_03050 [Pseudolabrys sp.]
MNYSGTGVHALGLIKSDGTLAPAVYDPTNGWGVTIPSTGTWFAELGSDLGGFIIETQDQSLSMKWTAALAATATFQVTCFPATLSMTGQGGADVSTIDATAAWQQFNPAASSSIAYTSSSGTGNAWTNLSLAMGGTNAGGAYVNMPGTTMKRMRIQLVVTVVGFIRILPWGKIGS